MQISTVPALWLADLKSKQPQAYINWYIRYCFVWWPTSTPRNKAAWIVRCSNPIGQVSLSAVKNNSMHMMAHWSHECNTANREDTLEEAYYIRLVKHTSTSVEVCSSKQQAKASFQSALTWLMGLQTTVLDQIPLNHQNKGQTGKQNRRKVKKVRNLRRNRRNVREQEA